MFQIAPNLLSTSYRIIKLIDIVQTKDYISGCGNFSLNSQSVSFLQAYLLLELISSALLAETGGKCPLVFSVNPVTKSNSLQL